MVEIDLMRCKVGEKYLVVFNYTSNGHIPTRYLDGREHLIEVIRIDRNDEDVPLKFKFESEGLDYWLRAKGFTSFKKYSSKLDKVKEWLQ